MRFTGDAEGPRPAITSRSGYYRLYLGQAAISRLGTGSDFTGQNGGQHRLNLGQLQ